MRMPRVSVIMPAFDSAAHVGSAIASVQAQTETDWELLVIDDGSRDETPGIVANAAREDRRIHLIRLAGNGGPAVARNAGIAAARGRYIAFLDSDDLWLPEKLARQLRFMEQRNAGFSYTGFLVQGADGRLVGAVQAARPLLTVGSKPLELPVAGAPISEEEASETPP
jgi:teichuronic acid biosynthesis glycosyltransferase TuaG